MPTLTTTQILADTLRAFRVQVPMIGKFATDFSAGPITLGETVKAHVAKVPGAADYDAGAGGYKNGATEARGLLEDVSVTVDSHKHVTLKWSHLNAIADRKKEITKTTENAAYALGAAMVNSVLAKVLAANASYKVESPVADVDRATLRAARQIMNANGAAAKGRVIIGSPDFVGNFGDDQRIASRDYAGQQTAGAYAHWQNIEGFEDIWEYPAFPANGEDLMGVGFESSGVVVRAGVPSQTFDLASQLGIPAAGATEVMTDPETGFSLLAINWQEPGTFDLYLTLVSIWGSAVGRAGGAAGAVTDKALVRFVDTTA